jgi:hypothetical protein
MLAPAQPPLGIRLDRIRAGMKGVVDGHGCWRLPQQRAQALRPGLYGKTGTAPSGPDSATVWFTGWLEAGSLPGRHRLAVAGSSAIPRPRGWRTCGARSGHGAGGTGRTGTQNSEQKRELACDCAMEALLLG